MSKTFVMGDLHGAHKAFKQVIERSGIDKENDTLIFVGDVTDGWSEVYECVEELLSFKNLIPIIGNHDEWFQTWTLFGKHPTDWLQGGEGTLRSYAKNAEREVKIQQDMGGFITDLNNLDIPKTHLEFFESKMMLHYVDEQNRCYVHGGFARDVPFKGQAKHVYYWDRDMFTAALIYEISMSKDYKKRYPFSTVPMFKEVYIGHTAVCNWTYEKIYKHDRTPEQTGIITTPVRAANIWNMDTGAGFNGKLSLMNVDTKELFQSDLVKELYPNERGR